VAHAASFDCAKATTSIEKTICADGNISDLDSQLMQSYKKSMSTAVNAEALKLEQRAWLTNVRNKCQDAACLKLAYADRIAQLDAGSKPASVQATQQVPVASVIDQPKASESSAVAATPSDIAQASAQPAVEKVEASSQVATPSKPTPAVETPAATSSSPTNPGMGITDVFHVLFSIGMIALVVGMVRPSLAAKWILAPTRKKIFGLMLIYLIPVAALSSFTETPERKAYEASLREQKEAEKVAKARSNERGNSSGGSRLSAEQLNSICVKGGFYALKYMKSKTTGQASSNLDSSMIDGLNEYPVSFRPNVKSVWMKMFSWVDRERDPRMHGDSGQQEAAALDMVHGCTVGMKRQGLL
jgi:uncharacterized protein